MTDMPIYEIHFKLSKHKQESGFVAYVKCEEKDLQGEKEHWAMYYEDFFETPVKVEKIVEVKEIPI